MNRVPAMARPGLKHRWSVRYGAVALMLPILCGPITLRAQEPAEPSSSVAGESPANDPSDTATPSAPDKVNVEQVVEDDDIAGRLRRILEATEWFEQPEVMVEDGVAILSGTTDDAKYREWAGKVAEKTEDVVAVVNRIQVTDPPLWDLSPAWAELRDLSRSSILAVPLLVAALLILIATWIAIKGALCIADHTVLKRIDTALLREVARKAMAVPLILLGLYLVLRVSGLTRLAMTVVGGTGLFGLILGIAFRDIAENFLASILLSMQNPFRYGDLIEVDGNLGYVQRVNTRGTLLMTLDGNHIQIPNSTIYKGTIRNFTANPNRRFEFLVGIGYDVAITKAQETAMRVLTEHPAVLRNPEPQVLVDELGSSTVNLRVLAWVNTEKHGWRKVRSSLIRLVKSEFEAEGFAMPDDQREVIFPHGVPVRILDTSATNVDGAAAESVDPSGSTVPGRIPPDREEVRNSAEGDLSSEADEVRDQALQSRDPDEGSTDLLDAKAE